MKFLFFCERERGGKRTLCPDWPNLKPLTGSTDLDLYAPPQKVAGYYVIPPELLSVCPSVCRSVRPPVCPSVRPSAVDHSCPLHNFDTFRDNFTKLGTNIKHDQTTCRD